MAEYILNVTGHLSNPKVLYLSTHKCPGGDYLCDTIFHGLVSILGQANVIDYPRRDAVWYTSDTFLQEKYLQSKHLLYGGGFTFAKQILELPLQRDRERISERIISGEFNTIIYGETHRSPLPFWDIVCDSTDRKNVISVYGGDESISKTRLRELKNCSEWFFSREMDDSLP